MVKIKTQVIAAKVTHFQVPIEPLFAAAATPFLTHFRTLGIAIFPFQHSRLPSFHSCVLVKCRSNTYPYSASKCAILPPSGLQGINQRGFCFHCRRQRSQQPMAPRRKSWTIATAPLGRFAVGFRNRCRSAGPGCRQQRAGPTGKVRWHMAVESPDETGFGSEPRRFANAYCDASSAAFGCLFNHARIRP